MGYLLSGKAKADLKTHKLLGFIDWLVDNVGPKHTQEEIYWSDSLPDSDVGKWVDMFMAYRKFIEAPGIYTGGLLSICHYVGEGWEAYLGYINDTPSKIGTNLFFVRIADDTLAVRMKLELFCE